MKLKVLTILLGLTILLSGCINQNRENGGGLNWFNYTEGLEEMEKTGKPAILFFCTYQETEGSYFSSFCKIVEENLFSNDSVVSFLKKFVTIKIDVYDQSQENVLSKYRFAYTPFPLVIFLDKNGKELSRLVAYEIYDPSDKKGSVKRFVEVLNLSLNGKIKGEDYRFITLSGEEMRLSDYRGKIVVLNLMSVNCPACRKEMQYLSEVRDHYRNDNDIVIISVDVADDNVYSIESVYGEYIEKWTFGIDKYGEASKYLLENAIPTIVVIDKFGRIFYLRAGAIPTDTLIDLIEGARGN